MTSQQKILDVALSLNSAKKKNKLEAFETLIELLNQNDAVKSLHESSLAKNEKITWNMVFVKVHNAILSLIDESSMKSRQLPEKNVKFIQDALQLLVQRSTYQKATLINSNLIVSSIMSIFETEIRKRLLGFTYFSIFSNVVLADRRNWSQIKKEYWLGMINICRKLTISPPSRTHGVLFLEALCEIIKNSSKTCQISQSFVELLNFVKDVFLKFQGVGANNEIILMRLTNLLCLQLAVEFRYKVCEFTEDMFDCVMAFHRKSNGDLNVLVNHFLIITLSIHNPLGVCERDRIFYAFNSERWKKQIKEIYFLCCNNIKESLKNSSSEINSELLDLFVDISHLTCIYDIDTSHTMIDGNGVESEPGPAKKRRISIDTQSQLLNQKFVFNFNLKNLVLNLETKENWFWLKFLEVFCLKYYDDLKSLYSSIIPVLCQIFCDKKNCSLVKSSLRCLNCILECESIWQLPEKDMDVINEALSGICSELFRLVGEENSTEGHKVVRTLLRNSKLIDPAQVLNFYCDKTVRDDDSFETLIVLCQNCILPEGIIKDDNSKVENIRELLLLWLVKGKENYSCKDLATLLIAIISKKFDVEKINQVKEETLKTHGTINDFCKSITDNYEKTDFRNIKFRHLSKAIEDNTVARVDSNLKVLLMGLLKKRWKQLFEDLTCNESSFEKQLITLNNCYWFCELICHFISSMEVINESMINDNIMIEELEVLLNACTTKTLLLLRTNFFDLGAISRIYGGNFHERIQKIIRETSHMNKNLLHFLFELFLKRNSNNQFNIEPYGDIKFHFDFSEIINNGKTIFQFNNLTKTERIFISSAEVLCLYTAIRNSDQLNEFQANLAFKIIDELHKDLQKKFYSHFQLQMAITVIYIFSKWKEISVAILNGCLKLLTNILDKKFQEPELNFTVLQIIKNLLPAVHRVDDIETQQNYLIVLQEFRNQILSNGYCGIKVVTKFLECLAQIHDFYPEGNWTLFQKDNLTTNVSEEFLTFFNHPYHEVRMVAAHLVGSFFVIDSRSKRKTILCQKELLKKLFSILIDNGRLFPKGKDCIHEYVVKVTTSVSLLALASIICKSHFWRKETFFLLFHLVSLKNVKQCDVKNVLELICEELGISNQEQYFQYNLEYFINKWAENKLLIEDFPYYIVGCKNLNEFFSVHRNQIVMIYSQFNRFEVHEIISKTLNLSSSDILKDCNPMILAFVLPSRQRSLKSSIAENILKLHKIVDVDISSDALCLYIKKNFEKIMFHMIKNMHDMAYLMELVEFFGNFEDDSNPLGFTSIDIVKTIVELSSTRSKSLFKEIALECPSVVERVLSLLLESVMRAAIYQDKVFAFYKYIFFVEMTSKIIGNCQQYKDLNTFFIRDVIYSVVAIIRNDDGCTLTNMACECLKKLAEACLKEFGEIFGEFLPTITTALIPLVLKSNANALSVLNYLICDNYSILKRQLLFLDPFPSQETFAAINECMTKKDTDETKTLEKQIKHFLSARNNRNSDCRVEGLKCLRKNLSDKKTELKAMYEALTALRGFSEDCEKSLLHRLICVLVELTTDKNVNVKMEAAKCLGEIGPSDLTTLVLRPENNFLVLKASDTPVNTLFISSLNFLSEAITADNYSIKKAASKALYAVLSVRQSQNIFNHHAKECKNFKYLFPFKSTNTDDLRMKIKRDVFVKILKDKNLWKPDVHETWITQLVDSLLQCLSDAAGIIDSFREMIAINSEFAEHLLPLLLNLIISSKDKGCNEIINENFRSFFENYFYAKVETRTSIVNKRSMQCLLNVVDYIRTQRHHEGFYEESCMEINYLHFSEAALSCSAFFTAIFYAELWFEQKRKGKYSQVDVNTICELFPGEGFALTRILRECYSKLGNSDGIHGCGYMHVLESSTEIQHYEHIGNWNLSLLHHDIQLSMGNKNFDKGLLKSLENSGMFYVLNNMVKVENHSAAAAATLYKCAIRLSDWSLLDSAIMKTGSSFKSETFDKSFYFALKAFYNADDAKLHNEIQRATEIVLRKLVDCSLESSKNLYSPLSELQTLKELDEFVSVLCENPKKSDLWNLFNKWRNQDDIRCGDFMLKESILTNRTIFLKLALEKAEKSNTIDDLRLMLSQTYCNIIEASRKEKKYDTAIRMMNYTDIEKNVPREIGEKLKLEKARILWERGDKDIAKFVLNHLIKKNEITGYLRGKGLKIYGDWMAKTKAENSSEIIGKYYLKSITQFGNGAPPIDAYASLAKFADSNYEQLNEYLSSPLFEIKQNLINTQQDLASDLRQELGSNTTQNKDKRIAYQIVSKQSLIDENEIKNNKSERDSYLCLALKYYLMSLKEGEKYNLFVFRVISLWLSNSNQQGVIEQLKKTLHQIPTYKFLCLLPQLVPRMADVCLISDLVERILQDHPYHTLPILFALSNSYEDLKYNGKKIPTTTPRVQAAKSILEKAHKNKKLEILIRETQNFSDALIELANYHPTDKGSSGNPIKFPDHLKIKKLKSVPTVSVPSMNLQYEKDSHYEAVIGVDRFEENYYLVGGINLPKKITCIGTDGISRSLLVKGKDDLRQDAVMQQVFTIINSLLSQNAETKKRKLIIRTYKVLPLSQRSGVIEWCENTQPLSLYLTGADGKSGAHKRFYPEEMSPFECRTIMRRVFATPGATNQNKLNTFLEITKQFHPVFHYFFIENFPAAGVWFERRLAYIHSVATSSMIGYVLGIGDRHVHNILIDNSTAEVIHIDLGIAFEQGKTLPIPETVPFRLTRDIVDGMGLSGIEGDFRISCIKTMEVLRENQDTILTLLEVLLYDPLYTWTITPEKAYSMQGQTEGSSSTTEKSSPDLEINKMAERALLRLKQKLEGTEAGWVATNVEGQVNYLIQQARDPNNLCRLFHGWQAYL